jgi:hypothetical protein
VRDTRGETRVWVLRVTHCSEQCLPGLSRKGTSASELRSAASNLPHSREVRERDTHLVVRLLLGVGRLQQRHVRLAARSLQMVHVLHQAVQLALRLLPLADLLGQRVLHQLALVQLAALVHHRHLGLLALLLVQRLRQRLGLLVLLVLDVAADTILLAL